MTSERDAGMPIWVLRVSAPFWRTASRADMPTMAKGLSWASQATVMAVKPAPAATPEVEALAARILAEESGRILGFRGAEAVPLDPADILRFYGEEKEVRAQTAAGLYTVRQRLYELEERLAALRFARISHSEIINLKQVKALDLTFTGTIRITLADGTVCWASRRYVKKIKEVLGL